MLIVVYEIVPEPAAKPLPVLPDVKGKPDRYNAAPALVPVNFISACTETTFPTFVYEALCSP